MIGDGAGGAIIVWPDLRSGNCYDCVDVYAQHLLASGAVDPAWPTDGRALCTTGGAQWFAVMATDMAGGAIVAWHDLRCGNCEGCADIYAQRLLATGVVDPDWPTEGRALAAAPGDQYFAGIVSDGAGGAIVAWEDTRSGNPDIYAQHVLVTGVVDPAWPTNGTALCTAPSGQAGLSLVADGAGGAIVAWTDARNANDDVYAQHVLATGVVDPAWPEDGLALASGPAEQANPAMVPDGAGGAIVTWTDAHRDPDGFYSATDVFAQHVLATGVLDPAWPVPALAVCTASGAQVLGETVADRAGGAIMAWSDTRSNRFDIYIQHVLATGVVDPVWPRDGLALCTAPPGMRHLPSLVADGTGGAIVAWDDDRGGGTDIYTQHVRGSGRVDPAWPADGRVLCNAAGDQWGAVIAADGAGRAIVAWQDQRSGEPNVYAARVFPGGGVPAGKPGAPATFRLYAAQPGPAHDVTIRFDLPAAGPVSVEVFDAAGRAVRTLAARQELGAGTHALVWDRADHAGVPVKRGVYLVRISTGARNTTGKVALF